MLATMLAMLASSRVLASMASMTGHPWLDAVIYWGAVVAALAGIGAGARWVYRKVLSPIRDFLRDWHGEEAREGVAARPGVMARLENIEHRLTTVETEFSPNHGSSVRDAIDRVEQQQAEILQKLDDAA